jgi:hypothetical protein
MEAVESVVAASFVIYSAINTSLITCVAGKLLDFRATEEEHLHPTAGS